ncbi:DUF2971 domain-containing protein [Caproiciproducens sp.]
MDYLFRYRTGSLDDLNCLLNEELWLGNPLNFNDPYDCAAQFTGEGRTEYTIKETLAKMIGSDASNINPDVAKMLTEKYREDNLEKWKQHEAANELFKVLLRHYISFEGVACFFPEYNSITMWSYYANCHKGFCIGYNYDDLNSIGSLNHMSYNNNFDALYRQLNTFSDNNKVYQEQIIKALILTKSGEWSHENEWRLIHKLDSPMAEEQMGTKVASPKPAAIYLGCKAAKNEIDLLTPIKEHCIKSKIRLFQMEMKPGSFDLIQEQIC